MMILKLLNKTKVHLYITICMACDDKHTHKKNPKQNNNNNDKNNKTK